MKRFLLRNCLLSLAVIVAANAHGTIGPCECSPCSPSTYISVDFSGDYAKITCTDGTTTVTGSRLKTSSTRIGGAGACWTPCEGYTWGTIQNCQNLCCVCGNCT